MGGSLMDSWVNGWMSECLEQDFPVSVDGNSLSVVLRRILT